MEPRCPHCARTFKTWPRARMHVKFCRAGPHPRETVAESVARRMRGKRAKVGNG